MYVMHEESRVLQCPADRCTRKLACIGMHQPQEANMCDVVHCNIKTMLASSTPTTKNLYVVGRSAMTWF